LTHAVILVNARRDHLRHVRSLVLPHGVDQIPDLSSVEELLEHGLEQLRLARRRAEAAMFVYDHSN
jgi:hypothetical protein